MNNNSVTVTAAEEAAETMQAKKGRGAVLRDAVLITTLSGLVVLTLGLFWPGDAYSLLWAISISNMILLPTGFTVSGCFARNGRFKHLFKVAIAVWFFSLVNVASGVATLINWASSAPSVFISMGIGGGLSLLIIRPSLREKKQGQT